MWNSKPVRSIETFQNGRNWELWNTFDPKYFDERDWKCLNVDFHS